LAVEAANSGAPIVTVMGMIIAWIGLWIVTILGIRFPNRSIIKYSEDVLGKWLARSGSLMIIISFAISTALTAREFGEVIVTAVLKQTPLEIIIITMLILAVVSARKDIVVFAYIHNFYLPFIIGPVLIIAALALKNSDPLYLQPIFGNNPSGMWTGVLTVAALFQGSFIMTIVIPAMRHPKKALKSSCWGILIAGGIYVMIVTVVLSVFGANETKLLLWPTLELAKMTSLPGQILERLDAVFLIVWVTAVFTTLLSGYFLTVRATRELFRLKDHKVLPVAFLPFIYIIAMLPQNIFQLYKIIATVGRWGLLLTIVYPLIVWVTAIIRKKGKKKRYHDGGNRHADKEMETID
ncbi:MAG TPA: endospore germination permease, partial [Bacillales bacterium]